MINKPQGLKKSNSFANFIEEVEAQNESVKNDQNNSQEDFKIMESVEEILSKEQFCFQYYHKKYRDARMFIIKKLFKSLTARWRERFVIYPLASTQEI